jgi:hypothetical protein
MLGRRQRMMGRNREHPFHHAEFEPSQTGYRRGFVRRPNNQVAPAFAKRLPRAAQHFIGEPEPDPGLQRVERTDDRHDQFELNDFVGHDP